MSHKTKSTIKNKNPVYTSPIRQPKGNTMIEKLQSPSLFDMWMLPYNVHCLTALFFWYDQGGVGVFSPLFSFFLKKLKTLKDCLCRNCTLLFLVSPSIKLLKNENDQNHLPLSVLSLNHGPFLVSTHIPCSRANERTEGFNQTTNSKDQEERQGG